MGVVREAPARVAEGVAPPRRTGRARAEVRAASGAGRKAGAQAERKGM